MIVPRLAPLLVCALGCMPQGYVALDTDTDTDSDGETTGSVEATSGGSFAPESGGIQTVTSAPTGGSSATEGASGPPEAPELSLRFAPTKQFEFEWLPAPGAVYYQLIEHAAPGESGRAIGEELAATATAWTMPLHLRARASYVLRACNEHGCRDSQAVAVADAMTSAIGFFKASNAESGDQFGMSVALSADGDTMVVGAPTEDSAGWTTQGLEENNLCDAAGAVYVFVRDGSTWVQQAYLKAESPGTSDSFGEVVAISGDGETIAVGAHAESSAATGVGGEADNEDAPGSGAVYVFGRVGGVWSQQAYVKASNTGAGDRFGSSVALSHDGDTLAVGAPEEDSAATGIDGDEASESAPAAGAVYVFGRNGGVWSQRAYLKASNTGSEDRFGYPCALAGDGRTLVVGAPGEGSSTAGMGGEGDDEAMPMSGAVYVFTVDDGVWSQQARIKASDPDAGDMFGYSLAVSFDGATLAAGAMYEASASQQIDGDQANDEALAAGAVYVFTRAGASWSQEAYVKAPNAEEDDRFGTSVALSPDGTTLAVGAATEDGSAVGVDGDMAGNWRSNSGAVYVFRRTPESWTHESYVKAPNTDEGDRFGHAVALSRDGHTLAVGAPGEASLVQGVGGAPGDNSGDSVGAVYLY